MDATIGWTVRSSQGVDISSGIYNEYEVSHGGLAGEEYSIRVCSARRTLLPLFDSTLHTVLTSEGFFLWYISSYRIQRWILMI